MILSKSVRSTIEIWSVRKIGNGNKTIRESIGDNRIGKLEAMITESV